MDARKSNVTLAHPYHEGKLCSKFGRIPPCGLGGDSVTDGQAVGRTDGGVNNIPIVFFFFFKKCRDKYYIHGIKKKDNRILSTVL